MDGLDDLILPSAADRTSAWHWEQSALRLAGGKDWHSEWNGGPPQGAGE